MRRCLIDTWVVLISLSLALLMSACTTRESTAVSPSTAVAPQTPASPKTPQPVLRIGMTPNYAPVAFKQQGRLTGLEADFATGIGDELGRRIELVELAWEALIPALEAGQIDVIMSGMSITEGRQRRVRFVKPYLRVGQMSIIRKELRIELGSPSLLERTSRRVGFVKGTTGAAYVQANLSKAQPVPLLSTDEGLQMLRAGGIDAFVHDAVTAWRVGANEAKDTLTASYSPLTEEHLAWAVRQDNDTLHRDLEVVLERWRRSERLQSMIRQWLSFPSG